MNRTDQIATALLVLVVYLGFAVAIPILIGALFSGWVSVFAFVLLGVWLIFYIGFVVSRELLKEKWDRWQKP